MEGASYYGGATKDRGRMPNGGALAILVERYLFKGGRYIIFWKAAILKRSANAFGEGAKLGGKHHT